MFFNSDTDVEEVTDDEIRKELFGEGPSLIDLKQSYDIYLNHAADQFLCYRDARFIARYALPDGSVGSFADEYWLIEQVDGNRSYIKNHLIAMIVEAGLKPQVDVVNLG